MVYIKKSSKVQSFLSLFFEKFPPSEEQKSTLQEEFLPLSQIEDYVSRWNEKNQDAPVFLHEMVVFSDFAYTLDYQDHQREKEFNTPEWLATKKKIKARQEEREYQRMIKSNVGVKKKNDFSLLAPGDSVKDFEQSVSFGVSFIFSLFLSGLSGYYFGIYCLGLNTNKALFVAAFATIATIIMETTLFMIKIGKKTQNDSRKEKEKTS